MDADESRHNPALIVVELKRAILQSGISSGLAAVAAYRCTSLTMINPLLE